jgi:hypothetical protein
VVAAALLGLTAVIASTAAAKRPLCKAGRFLVQGDPLISAGGGPQPVIVGEGRASIDEICPPTRAKLTRSKQGTAIAARWPACTGVEGKVRMKGTLDVACAALSGKLTAKKADLKLEFAALRSACGDGAFDPSGGEACDANLGCPADQHCTETCACAPGAPTTTTTVNTTPTTTTTCTASVTPTGRPAADYVMFSGIETGQFDEYDETSHCEPVTTPVRTGRYACSIPQGFFSAVRPSFSEREVFTRVYHRVEVVTNPSQIAFEPVIVTDVLPQGRTAVDVGVQSDGTIRYRLRNRFRSIDIGQSDPMPANVWRRIELATSMGQRWNEGTAELRIDGVAVVTADNLELDEDPMDPSAVPPPLDSIFISHNPNQYSGSFGGVWKVYYDDIAITRNGYPGEGRISARQGRPGASSANEFTLVGAATIDEAWSETPPSGAKRAETPAAGDPLAQTMLLAPFGQGVDPVCNGNVVRACQVWVFAALGASPADRTYATRRRVAGVNVDVSLPGECNQQNPTPACLSNQFATMQSDALRGGFWSASLDELGVAEIGAVKSGGAGGTPLRIPDAWLACEYQ